MANTLKNRAIDAQVTLVDANGVSIITGGAFTVDTELPAAALLTSPMDVAVTPVPNVGAILLAEGSGGTSANMLLSHDSISDARVNTLNGLVTQSRLYGHNHNTPGTGTDDILRTVRAADGNTGLGVLAAGMMGWDGAAVRQIKSAADGTTLVGGFTTVITTTMTRPADTNIYAAGDQVSNSTTAPTIITFANAARVSGGTGVIVGATITDSVLGSPLPDLELWLFDTTATPNNDNAAFAPTDGVANTVVAVIHLSATYAGTVNVILDSGALSIPFVTVAGTSLFGMLVVRNSYTPASGEVFSVRLRLLQD